MSADQATSTCTIANDAPWEGLKRLALPMLLVDIRRGALADANGTGARLWCGREDLPASLPLWDAAMPALHALRSWAALARDMPFSARLVFWTPRGSLSLSIRIARAFREDGLVALAILPSSPSSPEGALPAAGQEEPGGLRSHSNARLAHELRTPLAAVAAYAEAMAQEHFGPLGNERYREYALNLRRSALHALAVVEGMLPSPAKHTAASARELCFRDVDPAAVSDDCMTLMRPMAQTSGIRLESQVPQDLPRIVADDVSLRQILLNLLTNAIKFAGPGDRVSLRVSYSGGGTLAFEIEDTGPGIDATRAAAGLAAKGQGLGLPIIRELVEANGAEFSIESMPDGGGTRARVSFGRSRVVPI